MSKERLRLSISFREEYRHIYEHLQRQPNRSDYICRILDKEIVQEKSLEEQIAHILNLISNKRFIVNSEIVAESSEKTEQQLQNEDIDLINTLF
ncbi:hypothetical protein H5P36_20090 [Bacillus sp. APMAM]|nr:hypothetical protein [Bacillus sp. APMAM]RTZ54090.1 hypothetical protein EKO25_19865 [Bacillus sp. SAJ1]